MQNAMIMTVLLFFSSGAYAAEEKKADMKYCDFSVIPPKMAGNGPFFETALKHLSFNEAGELKIKTPGKISSWIQELKHSKSENEHVFTGKDYYGKTYHPLRLEITKNTNPPIIYKINASGAIGFDLSAKDGYSYTMKISFLDGVCFIRSFSHGGHFGGRDFDGKQCLQTVHGKKTVPIPCPKEIEAMMRDPRLKAVFPEDGNTNTQPPPKSSVVQ